VGLLNVIFMTFMVNVRHIFYGLSLLERFGKMGKKRPYMIFSLTDETYSLLCTTKIPKDVEEDKFLFAIAFLDHLYWIAGSAVGAIAGAVIPFNAEGIDFAMTALFIVIFVEQWLVGGKRIPAVIGVVSTIVLRLVFGVDNFVLPSMICIMICLVSGRTYIEKGVSSNAD
jgi:4-azaleucine resistance transporter AzlC